MTWGIPDTTPPDPYWWRKTGGGVPNFGGRTIPSTGGGGPTPHYVPQNVPTGRSAGRMGGGGPTPRYVPAAAPAAGRMNAPYARDAAYEARKEAYQNALWNAGSIPQEGATLEEIAAAYGIDLPASSSSNGGGGGGGSRRRSGGGSGGGSGVGAMRWPDVQKALQGAGTNIAGAYSAAGDQLAKLMGEYAAADAARRQAMGQTLQAFGAPQSAADVGGMSAMDVLAALRGQVAAQGGMQQADIEQQLAAYKALLGGK